MRFFRIVHSVLILAIAVITGCGSSGSTTQSGNTNAPQPSVLMGGAIQGNALTLAQSVTTFAGSVTGKDGTGASARFISPAGITNDGANLYVTDGDNTIRKIVIATGEVSTLAGTHGVYGSADGTGAAASFNRPKGIVTDGTNLFVADSQYGTIRKIVISTGVVSTFAGNPHLGGGSTDGTGTAATFFGPTSMATDGTNLYVFESQSGKVRKIVIATAVVTTLATVQVYGSGNLTIQGNTLYVADPPTIRKIDVTTGTVTTQPTVDPIAINPAGVAADGSNIIFADSYEHTIRKIQTSSGITTNIAGNKTAPGVTDGTGSAASFTAPTGVTFDGTNLFVIDDRAIRKVTIATGTVTTIAGSVTNDGVGVDARFRLPSGISTDGSYLYVTDNNTTIRKISIATGTVTTLAGKDGVIGHNDGIGSAARFIMPRDITTDGTSLYVTEQGTDTIRQIVIATGEVTTIAGTVGVSGSADGFGSAAQFYGPSGITTDGTNLYIADMFNNTVRKAIIATGKVTTIAGTAGVSGSTDGTGTTASFNRPAWITTDGTNLYVSDIGNRTIRKIVITTGEVTTLAGSAGISGSTDGIGSVARFLMPNGITTDGSYLYITDLTRIRKMKIATNSVTTIAGGTTTGSVDGVGAMAKFYDPYGIVTDGKSLFVADRGSNAIRKIE